jgi:hypothetical protein
MARHQRQSDKKKEQIGIIYQPSKSFSHIKTSTKSMTSHTELTDEIFLHQFANCSLDPKCFDHEAHLRLAWLYITKDGCDIALIKVTQGLMAYTQSLGAADKYNHTLTVAAVKAVNHFIFKSKSHTFSAFIIEFPRLKSNFMALMETHYNRTTLFANEAKSVYVEPDLMPF